MSAARRQERERQRRARKQALRAARAMGCVCEPEIMFGDAGHPFSGIGLDELAVNIAHDVWCPLLRVMEERKPGLARTQAILYFERGQP